MMFQGNNNQLTSFPIQHLSNTTQLIFNSNDTPLLKMCENEKFYI